MSEPGFGPLVDAAPEPAPAFRPLAPTADVAPGPGAAVAPVAAPLPETPDEVRRAFQAGYELGRDEVHARLETVAESFVKSLEELAAFRGRLRDRYERELLELSLGIARKIVQQELAERPEIWLGMIRAAVRRAVDREHIVLRVPPALSVYLRDHLPELRASLDAVKELELAEDPALPPGGCVIESRFGEVDIGVEAQIEAVERALVAADE